MYKQYMRGSICFLMLFLAIGSNKDLYAQAIIGPIEVYVGEVASYTFSDPSNTYFPGGWESDGELQIVENYQYTGYLPSMDVIWNTVGTHYIDITYLDSTGSIVDYVSLDVVVSYRFKPLAPRVLSNTGGVVTLAWALGQTPPPNIGWYWQSNSDGESFSDSGSTKEVYSDGTYFLKAYNPQTFEWSEASSITYTVAPPPTWYYDSDGDGFGNTAPTIASWTQPANYVDNSFDYCPSEAGPYNGCPDENNENYIHTITYNEPYSESALGSYIPFNEKNESITYFDGLGRPMQSIGIRAGGNSEDLITHIGYDGFGRQDRDYLPYALASGGGMYRPEALTATNSFYDTAKYENTLNPYSEKNLEASPLGRILEQGAPGADWAVNKALDTDHTIKFEHTTNKASDYVKRYGVSFYPTYNPNDPHLEDNGLLYSENELYKTVTKDENWQPNQTYPNDHTTEEYKDKQGRVILKRTFNLGKWHDTYYVYDDYGNLTYVLPPKMSTYKSILQQNWIGQSYYFDDVPGLYVFGTAYNDISFYFSSNGTFSIYIYAEGNMIQLKDGLVMDLGFISPSLPDMNLGTMNLGNGNPAGSAYIQSGNLYFTSSGNYDSTSGDFWSNLSVNLLDHQNSFVPSIDQAQLDDLAYQYRYDGRNRLIEKKIPGKGWESIVYNKLDQPILTQDAKLKVQDKWLFTKYDALGRVAYTGIMSSPGTTRANLQSTVDGYATQYETKNGFSTTIAGTPVYYSNNTYPQTISEVYTINYYDNYTFDGFTGMPSTVDGQSVINHNNDGGTQKLTKSLATGSKVRVLGSNPVKWITTVTGYDAKGRPIYIKSVNDYIGTTDIAENTLDFTGKVDRAKTTHQKTGQIDIVTIDAFEYDHAGRLVSQKQNINNQGEELIAKNHYDELGQLVKKDVGHTELEPLQQVDYTYNIRGWLKTINDPTNLGQDDDLFSFGLSYNRPEGPSTSPSYNIPLYNGNISHASWKTDNVAGGLRHYSYKYDALNRFANAYFAENNVYNSKFNEYIYGYDRNGNLHGLSRNMQSPSSPNSYVSMDNLTYIYDNGNRLMEVKDSYGLSTTGKEGFKDGSLVTMPGPGNDYGYDANGNMRSDANKGITSIAYNHLNLPTSVNIDYDSSTVGNVSYVYDATGVKLRKTVNDIGILEPHTYYAGNFVYETSTLKFFNQPEGYVEPKVWNDLSQGFDYVYQYKDHLGNIRLSYKDMDNSGDVEGATTPVFYDDLDNNSSSGWDSVGALHGISAPLDGAHVISGDKAVKIHASSSGSYYAHSNTWIPISNPQATDYIFSGWYYAETTGSVSGSWVSLSFFMNEDTETAYFTQVSEIHHIYTKNKWVYLEQRVTVPANIDKINLRVNVYNNGTTSPTTTAWFDNLSIRKANDPNDIEILEENNYYPFGLEHKGYNKDNILSTNIALKRKFGGKEYQDELGLNWYDITARNYDPALGRWMNLDPLAEQMRRHSPYNYAFDNPVYFIDYDGMMPFGSQDPPDGEDPPSVWDRAVSGLKNIISGVFDYNSSEINIDREKRINGSSPTEANQASDEKKQEKQKALGKIAQGTEDFVKGGVYATADKIDRGAQNVSEAADAVTVATGGASSEVTVPVSAGASAVSAGSKVVKASINFSDGDVDTGFNEVQDISVNIVNNKVTDKIVGHSKKTGNIETKQQEEVQSTVISTVISWFTTNMTFFP